MLAAAIRPLATLNALVARTGRSLAAVLLALMVLLALAQILSRALFSFTLDWAEELARFALVWSVLLVAPLAYRSGAHVSIAAFAEALPRGLLLGTAIAVNLLIVWICVVLLLQSAGLVGRGLTLVASSLPVRMAYVYSIVPVSFAALALVGLEHVLRLGESLRGSSESALAFSGLVPMLQHEQAGPAAPSTSDAD